MGTGELHADLPAPDRIRSRQDFARELTKLREQADLTVRELAGRIESHRAHSTIGDWFAGRSLPSPSSQRLLVDVLEMCGVTSDVDRWLAAWRRVQRTPGRRGAVEPYRGLATFQADDADWFFGREILTERVAAQVRKLQAGGGGLLMVVGASGAGKSSLLRAGVIPALTTCTTQGQPPWPLILMTPGSRPVDGLASALTANAGGSAAEVATAIRTSPATGILQPVRAVVRAAEDVAAHDRLLIVVDQFEELFTLCPDEAEQVDFITALAGAARPPGPESPGPESPGPESPGPESPDPDPAGPGSPGTGSVGPDPAGPDSAGPDSAGRVATVVVLGMRADFYPHALRHPVLARALQQAQFVVGPLGEDELRRAIVEPAHKARVHIDPGLVELLLRDVSPSLGVRGIDPAHVGALPLLSHALLTTWEGAQRGRMTVAGYQDSGGIEGAVARTAEAAYEELTRAQQEVAQRVFGRLVNLGQDTPDTRRKVERAELEHGDDEQVRQVIERFVERRLLTADADTIEISHEALLVAWPRLRGWIDSDREGLRVQRQLCDAAREWRELGHEPDALYRGGRLDTARDWAARGDHFRRLNPLEQQFLAAAVELEQAERLAARRRTRRLQQLVAALAALFLVAGGLAGYSYWKRDTANQERDLAVSRQVAIAANRLRGSDPGLAAQLSLAAYRIAPTMEARSSLLDSTGAPPVTRIVRPTKVPQNVVITPDGRTMIGAGAGPSDTAVMLWDLTDRRRPTRLGAPLSGHTKPVFGLAVSPNGRLLATGGMDRVVRLWDISDRNRPRSLGALPAGPANTIYSAAFSPDNKTLAIGSADRTVRLWDVTDQTEVVPLGRPLSGAAGYVQAVAFSPDRRTLVAVDSSGMLQVWELRAGGMPRLAARVRAGTVQLNTVVFAPGGHLLAVGGKDGVLQLWDVGRPDAPVRRQTPIKAPDNWVNSLAFSADGRLLAVGSSDDVAQVWELGTGRLVASLPHTEPVSTVAFYGDDRTLVTSGSDGVARLWAVPGPVVTGATDTVATTAFSPDGRSLAVVGGGAFLWDVSEPRAPVPLTHGLTAPGEAQSIAGAGALSPDGTMLAVGTAGTSVLTWDVTDPRRPHRLGPPLTGPAAQVESLAFSPDGRVLASGDGAGKVQVWTLTDRRRPIAVPVPLLAENIVYMIAFSPDSRTLAGVTADGLICLWDVSDPRHPVALPPVRGSADLLYSVAFSVDGRTLAVGSADGTVRLWSAADPRRLTPLGPPLTGPDGTVSAVAFGPGGRTLAATTRGGQVWFWDVTEPRRPDTVAIVTASSAAVWGFAFSPDGHTVATGGSDRTVRIWETDPARAAALICATGGDAVTLDEWRKYVPGVPYRAPC